jgi:hypothetical protein
MHRRQQQFQLALVSSPPRSLESSKKALNDMLLKCYLRDLESRNPRLRLKGAKGLESVGVIPIEAVPLLESLAVDDSDYRVRAAARNALKVFNGWSLA